MSRSLRKLSKVIKGSTSSSNNDNNDAESIRTNTQSRRNSSEHLSSVSVSEYPHFNSNYTQGDQLSNNKNGDEKKSINQIGIPEQTQRKSSIISSTSPSTSRQTSTSVNGNNHHIQPTNSNSSLASAPRYKNFSNTKIINKCPKFKSFK
ncbi:unnamed protein product [[Candida] boidinii]|nr:unnamed protein product [[Candida] boidinii]